MSLSNLSNEERALLACTSQAGNAVLTLVRLAPELKTDVLKMLNILTAIEEKLRNKHKRIHEHFEEEEKLTLKETTNDEPGRSEGTEVQVQSVRSGGPCETLSDGADSTGD